MDSCLSGPNCLTRESFSCCTGKHVFEDRHVVVGTDLLFDHESDWEEHGFFRGKDYFSECTRARSE